MKFTFLRAWLSCSLLVLFGACSVVAQQNVPVTPNLNIPLYPVGTPNWGPGINTGLSTIDAAIGSLQNAYQGAWSDSVTYAKGQIVTYSGSAYMSLQNGNINFEPATTPLEWGVLSSSGISLPSPGAAGYAIVSDGSAYTAQLVLLASQLSAANGVASLDANTRVPLANMYPCGASGGGHSAGIVPDPGSTTGVTRFLREDCTWQVAGSGLTVTGTPAAEYVTIATSPTTGVWRQLTQDDILPGFSISGFSGGSNVEIGATVSNPTFTASYSSTPTSATITNTDGTGSPLTLSSPFTSGTVTGSFSKTSAASTTFTLTAVSSSTKTATSVINWYPRIFAGVGAPGASSSVTASGTTAILSTTDVLASAGLGASQVGTIFGPFTPSAQKIYLLLIGGSHTFKDAVTGFAFAFNTPTLVSFTNANGDVVTMYLYEITNTLSGTFSIQEVS